MIPVKRFQQLLDLQALVLTARTGAQYAAAEAMFTFLADEVKWPFRASQEQIEHWNGIVRFQTK